MLRKTWERSARTTAVTTIAAMLLAGAQLLLATPGHADTLDAPTGLHWSDGSTATLSWTFMPGATSYRVQASAGSSTLFDVTTKNTSYVPTSQLPGGLIRWQVAATYPSGSSDFSQDSHDEMAADIPDPQSPRDGEVLIAPENPLKFRWKSVPGATSYNVQITDDPEFGRISATVSTKTATLSLPKSLSANGTYYWRVEAVMSGGVVSGYAGSDRASTYTIKSHPSTGDETSQPVAPRPLDGQAEAQVTDTALAWPVIPGATTYTLQVSTDQQFLESSANVATIAGIRGTRYSPPAAWDSDQYYWRVQGFDASGNALGWMPGPSSSPWQFERRWNAHIELDFPADLATVADSQHAFFQWEPVPHASHYSFQISGDPTFPANANITKTCTTTNTTFTPYYVPSSTWTSLSPKCIMVSPGGTYYWRVRAVDAASGSNLTDVPVTPWSDYRTFVYQPSTGTAPTAPVTSFTAGLTGTSLFLPAEADAEGRTNNCDPTADAGCHDLSSTPVLTWPAQQGVQGYAVRVYHNREMTNEYTEYAEVVPDATWSLPSELADSQTDAAYWVSVTPCPHASQSSNDCAQPYGLANAQFNITSKKVHLCGATIAHDGRPDDNGLCTTDSSVPELITNDNVTLNWSDYLASSKNDARTKFGAAAAGAPGTEARVYWVQVATDDSFSSATLIDNAKVDQTTFTSTSHTYPSGPIFWRVAAIDGSGNPLSWSETASFTKKSIAPQPSLPANNADAAATPILQWIWSANTKSYNVEVYRDTDSAVFNTRDRVLSANTLQTAWAFTAPLAQGRYLWRLQRVDSSGIASPWSADTPVTASAFTVTSRALTVDAPDDDGTLYPSNYVFAWNPDPDYLASTYRFERRKPGTNTIAESQVTSALAWAPLAPPANNSTWQWRVVPVDAAGNDLAASPWRTVQYVSGPAAQGTLLVEGSPQVGTSLKAIPPDWGMGDVRVSYQWYYSSAIPANAIPGADEQIYNPTSADLGKSVLVVATAQRDGFYPATAQSAPQKITQGAPPTLANPFVIVGTGQVGTVVTASANWTQSDVATTYQWLRDGRKILGADSDHYTVVPADYGHVLAAQATGKPTDPAFKSAVVVSDSIAVLAGDNLLPRVLPTVSGTAGLGTTIYANHGTWANADYATKYSYQWQRNGVNITGATTSYYRAGKADIGKRLRVVVTATRTGYAPGRAASAALFVPKVTTTMFARLSPSMVKVRKRAKVLITLYTPWLTGPTGKIQVFVDGHKRVIKGIAASALGKKTIKLPRLKKGKHKVQVRYLGSRYTTAKKSPKMKLTVYK